MIIMTAHDHNDAAAELREEEGGGRARASRRGVARRGAARRGVARG